MPAQRRDQVGIGQDAVHLEVALELGLGVALGVAAAARGHLGHVALAVLALVEQRPGLQRRQADGVGSERRQGVGVELEDQRLGGLAHRRAAEAEDQRRVDLAGLDLHPGLVERPGAVHLDVRLRDRRPGADGVHGADEGEGLAREVVGAARDREADLLLRDAGALHRLVDHRHQHLDFVAQSLAPHVGRLRVRDDGDVAHQACSLNRS